MGEKKVRELYNVGDLAPIRGLAEYVLPKRHPSVYFLSNFDEIVYIGQSIDLVGRIAAHKHKMSFDRVHYFEVMPKDGMWLTEIECAFIKKIMPVFNMSGKAAPPSERHLKHLEKYCEGAGIIPTHGWVNG